MTEAHAFEVDSFVQIAAQFSMSLRSRLIALLVLMGLPWSMEYYCEVGQCATRNITSSNTNNLKSQLLVGYDRWQPPREPTFISLLLHVDDVYKIDTQEGAYWMDVVATVIWCDCALAYDPTQNHDVQYVTWSFDNEEIWQPQLRALAIRDLLPRKSHVQLVSYYNGTVFMDQPFMAEYRCRMDLDDTPYDTQFCNWTVQSRFPSNQVTLGPWVNPTFLVGDFGLLRESFKNQEWGFQNWTTRRLQLTYNGLSWRDTAQVFLCPQ